MKIEEEIMQLWFKNHKVVLTQQEALQVLTWKQPDTIIYYVRYVFDGCFMYVSGDLGEAVFRFSEKVSPQVVACYDIQYFEEKMRAFSDSIRDFNQEKAIKNLAEYQKDYELSEDVCSDVRRIIYDCSSSREWESQMYSFDLSRLGDSAWEWVYGIGDEIPARVKAYLLGIKMAAQQLEELQKVK